MVEFVLETVVAMICCDDDEGEEKKRSRLYILVSLTGQQVVDSEAGRFSEFVPHELTMYT